jgi:hypothetical protein
MSCKEDEFLPLIEGLHVVQRGPLRRVEKDLTVPSLPQVPDINTSPSSLLESTALAFNGWVLLYRFERRVEFVKVLQHGAGKGVFWPMR